MQQLEKINLAKDAINEAPLNKFTMISKHYSWSIVCYKFQPLIDMNAITIRSDPAIFQLFQLYLLESITILSAYVFYIPGFEVDVSQYYVKIIRPSAKKLTMLRGVKMILQDNRLNIFHSDDGATLISVNGLKEIIKPSMIRKSDKTEQQDNE